MTINFIGNILYEFLLVAFKISWIYPYIAALFIMDGYFDYIPLCNYILDPFYEIQFQSTTIHILHCINQKSLVFDSPSTHKERSSSYSIILLHAAYLAYMYIPPLYLNYVKSLYRFLSRLYCCYFTLYWFFMVYITT